MKIRNCIASFLFKIEIIKLLSYNSELIRFFVYIVWTHSYLYFFMNCFFKPNLSIINLAKIYLEIQKKIFLNSRYLSIVQRNVQKILPISTIWFHSLFPTCSLSNHQWSFFLWDLHLYSPTILVLCSNIWTSRWVLAISWSCTQPSLWLWIFNMGMGKI